MTEPLLPALVEPAHAAAERSHDALVSVGDDALLQPPCPPRRGRGGGRSLERRRAQQARRGSTRALLTEEAARLMYEEGVKQYFTAKRMAARRVLGRRGARSVQFRPADLPSNGEIKAALLRRAELAEGPDRVQRLFAMRVVALETMDALTAFTPRLIGSVSTGHVRRGSDIDLHVFVPGDPRARELDAGALLDALEERRWTYETRRVLIRKGGRFREFTHVDLDRGFRVELSVYATAELRVTQRSSTDGKPIDRMSATRLRAIIEREHASMWSDYQRSGELAGLAELLLAEEDAPDQFDGLLRELSE